MSGQHGGYRKPEHPAPASGPGRLSRRTDGGPTQKLSVGSDLPYGDRAATLDAERSAGMAATDTVKPAQVPSGPQSGASAPPQFAPLDAPTDRPGEPVTHGVDIGAGGGSDVLGPFPMQASPAAGTGTMTAMLSRLASTDTTGILGQLLQSAASRNA